MRRSTPLVAALVAITLIVGVGSASAATIANPGPFTASFTSGSGNLGPINLVLTPVTLSGTIDSAGNVTVPASGVSNTAIPFSTSVSGMAVDGSVSWTAVGAITGTLDPASGAASLSGAINVSMPINAPAVLYSGVCSLGTLPITLTTGAPGAPYSQATGTLTLSTPLPPPSVNCTPGPPFGLLSIITDQITGGRLTLSGQVSPAITEAATGGGTETSGAQTVTAEVGSTIAVSATGSVAFPRLLPGQTSAPIPSAVTVTSNDPAGYQLGVSRTAFQPTDIPLSVQSGAPGAGMVLDLAAGVATAIPTTGSLAIGHRAGSVGAPAGDVWPTSLILGPVPSIPAGTYAGTVTYTVVSL